MRGLWIVVVFSLGCSAAIEHGLDESAANEVVATLERAGIGASTNRDDGNADAFMVSVGKSDVVRSMELLRSLGLPRGHRTGFSDVYKPGSLLPTPTEERAKYIQALSGEIVKTLETVDGVASARVHLVLPEPEPLAFDDRPRSAAQAAVLIKTHAQALPITEADVRRLVSGSVPGLAPAAVAVVFTSSAPPSASAALVSLGPLRMTAGSRRTAIAVAATGCLLLGLLAAMLLATTKRIRSSESRAQARPEGT